MNADRESTKSNPVCGDEEPPATSGKRPAAVADSQDAQTEPTPFRLLAHDGEQEPTPPETRRALPRLGMFAAGFVGFPGFVIAALVASLYAKGFFMFVAAGVIAFVALSALLAMRRFAVVLGGIAGFVTLYLLVRSSCGW